MRSSDSGSVKRAMTAKRCTGQCNKFARPEKIEAVEALIIAIDLESSICVSEYLYNSKEEFFQSLELTVSRL